LAVYGVFVLPEGGRGMTIKRLLVGFLVLILLIVVIDAVKITNKDEYKGMENYSCIKFHSGNLYALDSTIGILYCFNSSTGEIKWSYDANSSINFNPHYFDGKVYLIIDRSVRNESVDNDFYNDSEIDQGVDIVATVIRYKSTLLCLDAVTGSKVWEQEIEGYFYGSFISEGNIIVQQGGYLFCFDSQTGIKIFEQEIGDSPYGSSFSEGKVFIHQKGYLLCLDIKTGEKIWKQEASGYNEDIIVKKDKIYEIIEIKTFGTNPKTSLISKLVCFDIRDGNKLWEIKNKGDFYLHHIFESAGKIYYLINGFDDYQNSSFMCIDILTGIRIWEYKHPGYFYPPSFFENYIFFRLDKTLLCLDASTGKSIWNKINIESYDKEISNKIYLISDELLPNKSSKSCLLCLDTSTGRVVWQYNQQGSFISQILFDNNVYANSRNREDDVTTIHSINALTGALNWKYEIPCQSYLHSIKDGKVYIETDRFANVRMQFGLICLDARKGEKIWDFKQDGQK